MMYIIGGKFKRRHLSVPKSESVRPTTSMAREALFNICQQSIVGSTFLDLFAGSGAMGLEALSRGALHATFVENHPPALAAIKKNIAALQVEAMTTVLAIDVFKALQRLFDQNKLFELIYADPPYGQQLSGPVLEFLDNHPLLAKEGSLFVEDAEFMLPPLKHLILKGKRRMGRANLYEFRISFDTN